jgi:serine/threonine-protein kinase HipA
MQSLAALAHLDFNDPNSHSYEQALLVIRQLGLPKQAAEQQFRRMVFNVVGRNQDDHVKNIAFLMDRQGAWSLSPAFDMTWSYNPSGAWTARHQMSINGKRDGFTREDFRACARAAALKRGLADDVLDEVIEVVKRWPDFAEQARVGRRWQQAIEKSLRLRIPAK